MSAGAAEGRGDPGAEGQQADLCCRAEGKKVALNKGSNVHYLLVKALERPASIFRDRTGVPRASRRARGIRARRGGSDAWVIWDPFQAAAEAATGARTLADGTASSRTTSSISPRRNSSRTIRRSSIWYWHSSARSMTGPRATSMRSPSSWRRRSGSRLRWSSGAEAAVLRHQAAQ